MRSVIDEIVVDTGGAGVVVAEELRRAGFKVRAKDKRPRRILDDFPEGAGGRLRYRGSTVLVNPNRKGGGW